jgi:hypothetical protein
MISKLVLAVHDELLALIPLHFVKLLLHLNAWQAAAQLVTNILIRCVKV